MLTLLAVLSKSPSRANLGLASPNTIDLGLVVMQSVYEPPLTFTDSRQAPRVNILGVGRVVNP
ncbi:hypothetical protein MUK42_17992 [Musa troglodytarum]|uniref:Uncharacterized protein n=1 Tax=Musa troglodytarum TaxID=320322 RepID=A0A9E7LAZ0_9LILI|nr:hypothetical protein MUK42_17992 [Musa troglodytarum]